MLGTRKALRYIGVCCFFLHETNMAALRSVVLLLLVYTGASAESKYIQFQIYVYLYYTLYACTCYIV